MKTMLLAATGALSLGIGSAYADGGGQATTLFTLMEARHQTAPAQVVPAQNASEVTRAYVTHSNQGTWLFPASQNEGSNN